MLTVSTVFSPKPSLGFFFLLGLFFFLDVSICYLFYVSAVALWDVPTLSS